MTTAILYASGRVIWCGPEKTTKSHAPMRSVLIATCDAEPPTKPPVFVTIIGGEARYLDQGSFVSPRQGAGGCITVASMPLDVPDGGMLEFSAPSDTDNMQMANPNPETTSGRWRLSCDLQANDIASTLPSNDAQSCFGPPSSMSRIKWAN